MLQQTTVSTVENKLKFYLKKFPDFESYKNQTMNSLLNSWSGLGYYNRAENLYQSIKIINSQYKSKLPEKKTDLLNLPGIGEYTASAIIAIGFNKKAFPIDVNVRRLISRLVDNSLLDRDIENILEDTFKKRINYRNFAESMMDYSSLICKKKLPLCEECIFKYFCKSAFKNFKEIRNKQTIKKNINFYIIENNGSICFIKKPNFQFYKKFLHLPSNLDKKFLKKLFLQKKVNYKSFNYSITNHRFEVKVYYLKHLKILDNNCVWIKRKDLKRTALPTLFKKILF